MNMSHELVDLTVPEVMQEIEHVLDDYPTHPYQSAFSKPELRQKLIAHVLSLMPNYYITKEAEKPSNNAQVRYSSRLQERLHMGMIIRGGILNILRSMPID